MLDLKKMQEICDQVVEDSMKYHEEEDGWRPRHGNFYASEGKSVRNLRDLSTFKCARSTYFDFVHLDKKQPLTDRTKKLFKEGKRIEIEVIKEFKRQGKLFRIYKKNEIGKRVYKGDYKDIYIRDKNMNIGGVVDAGWQITYNGQRAKKPIPVEIKRVSHFNFNRLDPLLHFNTSYRMQANYYAINLKVPFNCIYCYNPNTLKEQGFMFITDKELYEEQCEYFSYIQRYLDRGTPPPRDYDMGIDPMCSYCSYYKYCATVPSPPTPAPVMYKQSIPKRSFTEEEKEAILVTLAKAGDLKMELDQKSEKIKEMKAQLKQFMESQEINCLTIPGITMKMVTRENVKWNRNKLEPLLKEEDLWNIVTSLDNKKIKRLLENDPSLGVKLSDAKEITETQFVTLKVDG